MRGRDAAWISALRNANRPLRYITLLLNVLTFLAIRF
jgi:hypothetical protein